MEFMVHWAIPVGRVHEAHDRVRTQGHDVNPELEVVGTWYDLDHAGGGAVVDDALLELIGN